MADAGHHELFEHLYGCLSILVSKSSSLLMFNSIIIAVYAIFVARGPQPLEWIPIGIGMVTVLISCFLLLSVVWVHWSTTTDLYDADEHALTLLRVWLKRTIKYRLAWNLAEVALAFLSVFLVLHFLLLPGPLQFIKMPVFW